MGNAGVPIMVVVQKCILTSAANSTRKQLLVYNTHTHTKKKKLHAPGEEQLEVMDSRFPGLVRSELCANSILINDFNMLKRTEKLATDAWTGLTCPGESHAGKCAHVLFVVRRLGAKKKFSLV